MSHLEHGVCGACARPATRFPSGRWSHDGRPCAARSQSMWRPGDLDIARLCRFIADGDTLPGADPAGKWAPTDFDDNGFPIQLGWRSPGSLNEQIARVRVQLATEADGAS